MFWYFIYHSVSSYGFKQNSHKRTTHAYLSKLFCRVISSEEIKRIYIWYVISLLFILKRLHLVRLCIRKEVKKKSKIWFKKITRNTQCLMSTAYIFIYYTFLFHFPATMKLHSIYICLYKIISSLTIIHMKWCYRFDLSKYINLSL